VVTKAEKENTHKQNHTRAHTVHDNTKLSRKSNCDKRVEVNTKHMQHTQNTHKLHKDTENSCGAVGAKSTDKKTRKKKNTKLIMRMSA
jgi:IMP dehydrogenase/GMP reductase